MDCLKEIAPNSPFTSRSGLSARLSKRSLGKKITVKEYLDTDLQNKLYSIEVADVDLYVCRPVTGEHKEIKYRYRVSVACT